MQAVPVLMCRGSKHMLCVGGLLLRLTCRACFAHLRAVLGLLTSCIFNASYASRLTHSTSRLAHSMSRLQAASYVSRLMYVQWSD